AVEPRLDLADAGDVHDRRTVDAYEVVRGKRRLERRERLPDDVRLVLRVDLDVVARRLEPLDVLDVQEGHAPARSDRQATAARAVALELLDQAGEPLARLARPLAADPSRRATERLAEPVRVE